MKMTYYVANDNGDLACHDCDLLMAQDVLALELEKDPENTQGWEILDAEEEEEE